MTGSRTEALLAGLRRQVARTLGGDHELGTRGLLRLALLMGVLAGGAEALYLTLRQLIRKQPALWYFPEIVWMAPLVAALAFVFAGAVVAMVARGARTGVDVARATAVFGFLAIYGVVESGSALHPAAEVLLSLGAAVALARLVGKRPARAERWIQRATPAVGVALVLLIGWGVTRLPALVERRALAALPSARDGAPNVLLIILDTVRAANLGLYGYHRDTSPHLDRWAARGVVFDRAVSTAPWTLPSHATMFTGHYNYELNTGVARALDDRHATLAEVLRERGYATAAFVANLGYTTRMSGLDRGFARFEDFPVTHGMFLSSSWLPRKIFELLTEHTGLRGWEIPKIGERLTDEFLAWLEHRPDRPFFVFLNYYDAHGPYDVPGGYRTRFGPAPEQEVTADEPRTIEELATSVNAYDGCIAYLDDQLARLFTQLDATGVADSTLVIVTSDHGEMFGERGQVAHTSGLYMPSLHVPLAMVLPSAIPEGIRVSAPVTLRDLPATILDLTGVAPEATLPGASLASHWSGADTSVPSPLLAELDYYAWAPDWTPIRRGDMKSLIEDQLHYIRNGDGAEEVYDVVADASAERDLIAVPELKPVIARFRAVLDSILP